MAQDLFEGTRGTITVAGMAKCFRYFEYYDSEEDIEAFVIELTDLIEERNGCKAVFVENYSFDNEFKVYFENLTNNSVIDEIESYFCTDWFFSDSEIMQNREKSIRFSFIPFSFEEIYVSVELEPEMSRSEAFIDHFCNSAKQFFPKADFNITRNCSRNRIKSVDCNFKLPDSCKIRIEIREKLDEIKQQLETILERVIEDFDFNPEYEYEIEFGNGKTFDVLKEFDYQVISDDLIIVGNEDGWYSVMASRFTCYHPSNGSYSNAYQVRANHNDLLLLKSTENGVWDLILTHVSKNVYYYEPFAYLAFTYLPEYTQKRNVFDIFTKEDFTVAEKYHNIKIIEFEACEQYVETIEFDSSIFIDSIGCASDSIRTDDEIERFFYGRKLMGIYKPNLSWKTHQEYIKAKLSVLKREQIREFNGFVFLKEKNVIIRSVNSTTLGPVVYSSINKPNWVEAIVKYCRFNDNNATSAIYFVDSVPFSVSVDNCTEIGALEFVVQETLCKGAQNPLVDSCILGMMRYFETQVKESRLSESAMKAIKKRFPSFFE